ncbi:MAG: hypothetical protein HY077_16425 [Elusimicrobia bacterium]|nr:hypothetical protein [Elusimicrobiota bacterium]
MAPSKSEVRVTVRKADELAFLGAAYLATDLAYALVSRKGKDWSVALTPKSPKTSTHKVSAAFREAYEGQLLRWAIARNNRGMRAEVLKRALALCQASGGRPASRQGSLLPEQKEDIARLLAEAEADQSPKDPLGITRNWEDTRGEKA